MEDLRSGARMVPWILKRGSRSLEDKDKFSDNDDIMTGVRYHIRKERRRTRSLCKKAIPSWGARLLLWRQEDPGGAVPLREHDLGGGGGRRLLLLQPG